MFDGTGVDGGERDVGLADGRIAAVASSLGDDTRDLIDARGLAVAPGFIDIHSHADDGLFVDPLAESVIRQGVTTVIVNGGIALRDGQRGPRTGRSIALG